MIKGAYIHIPFCEQICIYCDFHKEIARPQKKVDYIHRLIQSLKDTTYDLSYVQTIFIGGGTPTNIDNQLLEELFIQIRNTFDFSTIKEFNIEGNPNDITKEKANLFYKYGINRVSLGVQSFDDEILTLMNRSHRSGDIKQAITHLKEAGIKEISIDLIFGFHHQTLSQVEYDIAQAMNLGISHLSYYALILEEKSIMHYLIRQGKMRIVDEDLDYLMYNKIIDSLTKYGYEHYEISNFAKPGHYSMHNMLYWTQKEYLGFGSGAHSYVNQKRFHIRNNVGAFIESKTDENCTTYYDNHELEDALLFGLRVLKGINIQEFEDQYHIVLFNRYPVLHTFIVQDMLAITKGYLHLTDKGLMLANNIFAALMEEHNA